MYVPKTHYAGQFDGRYLCGYKVTGHPSVAPADEEATCSWCCRQKATGAASTPGWSPAKRSRLGDWKRSSFHQPTRLGDCVEVRRHGDGVIGVTDARRREALSLLFSPEAWAAFVAGVKAGEFDFGEVPADGS